MAVAYQAAGSGELGEMRPVVQLGRLLPVVLSLAPMRVPHMPLRRPWIEASDAGRREADAAESPSAEVSPFENTQWSFYLALDEGGRTLFTLLMQPGGIVKFGNGGEDGTWRTRQGYLVVKQPTFLFGNDLYYSGRIVMAGTGDGEEADVLRLADGIVDTEQSRKLVRIGAFSAHQVTGEEDDDYEDEDEDTISRILD